MGNRRRKRDADGQMMFDFRENLPTGGGEVSAVVASSEEGPQKPVKRKHHPVDTEDLMGRVADAANLVRAWTRVRSNRGSGGVDGETIAKFGEGAWTHIREIQRELLAGRYRPKAVRGVQIPKPSGGTRQLGIPTVKDRIVQQALAQVLMPRYERVFSDSSYGFRPNRGAHDALRRGSAYVAEGYFYVVDLDLEKFFDRVNHDRLMARLARDIGDGRVLRLILGFLRAGLMQNGVCRRREEGTPQGGPLSPLLANIVLDELDRELERRGHRFCRYADDCNIYVRSRKAGERVMESITRFITRRLRLKVNEAKSKVDVSGRCTYLGCTIGSKGRMLIAPKSQSRMRAKLKEITTRNRGRKFEAIVDELNRAIRGWNEYFKLATSYSWRERTDRWLRHRLRCYRLKQCKRGSGIFRFLVSRGLSRDEARLLAGSRKGWYRRSNTPQASMAMGNDWFKEIGLETLYRKQVETARCQKPARLVV